MSNPQPSWLPVGGRADVVLAEADAVPPRPTCLVRLLVMRERKVLAVHRADGRGLDIPTLLVEDGAVDDSLQALVVRVLGKEHPTELLGYVRNTVPGSPADYPWPSPQAHFAVWHCASPIDREIRGVWLEMSEAEALLGDRHWWPLAAHARRMLS